MKERDPGQFVEKLPHDKCGSSDALAVYQHEDGSHSGYCWSCQGYEADPYGTNEQPEKEKTKVQLTQDNSQRVAEIFSYPSLAVPHRLLRASVVEYYGVRCAVSQVDGATITHMYYPMVKSGHITAYKERDVALKSFRSIGDAKGAEFFGQAQARATGSKKLYITEGEDDCMCLFQALLDDTVGTKWAEYTPAVVSLPTGASAAVKVVTENSKFIESFEEVILVFDSDEAGQKAVEDVLKVLPIQKTKIARLPMKDSSDMYVAGRHADLVKLVLWKAETPKISSVATAKELKLTAMKKPEWGAAWPWRSVTELTYGIRKGLIGVGAGVGVGKSSLWHQTQQELIFNQGTKCGLFMLEESNETTLIKLASKQVGIDFTNPDGDFTDVQLHDAIDKIPDDLLVYRHKGSKDWEEVRMAIKHMVLVEDVKYVFVDPITALVAHLTSSEANDELNKMFSKLASMIEAMDFTVFYGAHLNPPKTGASHEEGGRVTLAQFTGSKAMIKWSHLIFGLERNTQAESWSERNTALLRVLKDRDFGRTGKTVSLTYDESRSILIESKVQVSSVEKPTPQHLPVSGEEPRY